MGARAYQRLQSNRSLNESALLLLSLRGRIIPVLRGAHWGKRLGSPGQQGAVTMTASTKYVYAGAETYSYVDTYFSFLGSRSNYDTRREDYAPVVPEEIPIPMQEATTN